MCHSLPPPTRHPKLPGPAPVATQLIPPPCAPAVSAVQHPKKGRRTLSRRASAVRRTQLGVDPPHIPAVAWGSPAFARGEPGGRRRGAGMSHTRKESGVSSSSVKSGGLPCCPPPSCVGEGRMLRDEQAQPPAPPELSTHIQHSAPVPLPRAAAVTVGTSRHIAWQCHNPRDKANERLKVSLRLRGAEGRLWAPCRAAARPRVSHGGGVKKKRNPPVP